MPSDKAAITANMALALLLQRTALMTKQDPIPVVQPRNQVYAQSAEAMRMAMINLWETTSMLAKTRRIVFLGSATRTCAFKVVRDPVMNGGHGGVDTDIVPGWNLIIDNNASDKSRMEFCGDRVPTTRSRAMLMYPKAADKIREAQAAGDYKRADIPRGLPVSNPWSMQRMPQPGATIVNGKPVITAFAGEISDISPYDNHVEIIEMYWRDHSLVEKMVPQTDSLGRVKQEISSNEDGTPKINWDADEMITLESGMQIGIPNPQFVLQDVLEKKVVRIYPHWRRTTIMMPDQLLLEDVPWDGPLPYAIYTDLAPLTGILGRGRALQTEQLQGLLNVGMSISTDNMRMGSINAFFAGSASGLDENKQIIPGVGQVIPVGDTTQIKEVPHSGVDANVFALMDKAVSYMERIIGTYGVMLGQAPGRVDNSKGLGNLQETGGAVVDMDTDNLSLFLAEWAEIAGWFMQNTYDEHHAIEVEEDFGNPTWQRIGAPYLAGSFNYKVEIQTDRAWSESARQTRDFSELQAGLIDKIEYYTRRNYPNWRNMLARMVRLAGPQVLLGPAGAPPPRTRQTVPKAPGAQRPRQPQPQF